MERIDVKVRNPNIEFDVYVNGALVRSVATLNALKRYLRWLWVVNDDYAHVVIFDLQIFVPEFQKELRDYIFG